MKKVIPFMQSVRKALAANGTDSTGTITADSDQTIVIEQIANDTRVTAGLAVTDNQVLVDLKDKINNSYTNGETPIASIAGKATTGMPKFLPMKIVIPPGGSLTAALRDLSGTANTVDLCFIGYTERNG